MSIYAPGDTVTLAGWPDTIWCVRSLSERDGRTVVGLADDGDSNHGTAFFADVLDTYVVSHMKANGS